jgi:hypothetical protein
LASGEGRSEILDTTALSFLGGEQHFGRLNGFENASSWLSMSPRGLRYCQPYRKTSACSIDLGGSRPESGARNSRRGHDSPRSALEGTQITSRHEVMFVFGQLGDISAALTMPFSRYVCAIDEQQGLPFFCRPHVPRAHTDELFGASYVVGTAGRSSISWRHQPLRSFVSTDRRSGTPSGTRWAPPRTAESPYVTPLNRLTKTTK